MPKTCQRFAVLAAALGVASIVQAADRNYQGLAKVSLYKNIGGTAIADLTGNAKYPNSPDEVRFVDVADAGSGIGDNYGGRIEFLWSPPSTGQYQFAIAADDNAQLWISTDETAANLKQVAREPEWNGNRSFGTADRRPGCGGTGGITECENVSDAIQFQQGRKYLVVGLWKEGGGGDNFAVAVKAPGDLPFADNDEVIPAGQISVNASDAVAVLGAPVASQSFQYVGQKVRLSSSLYTPPNANSTIAWSKDGVAIPGATSAQLEYTAVAADAGKTLKFKVSITGGGVTAESSEVSVAILADQPDVLSPGFLKVEFFNDIGGTAVQGLLDSEKYQNNQPDEIRYVSSFSSPDGYGENYGARVSGFIIPAESGDYRFFIRSDDASQLFLSADSNPANAQMIAEETGCCGGFEDPANSPTETSEPITLQANRQYAIYALVKEGGGGDYVQVAWRKEGDTTPAGSLTPIRGTVIATMAEPAGANVVFTQQPSGTLSVEETKTVTLSAAATGFPINAVFYQWLKDGQPIPGATGSSYTTPPAVAGTTAKYAVTATTLANAKSTSTEVTVNGVADTKAPAVVSAGTVKKGGKIEIGVRFDEPVDQATASAAANYSLSAGTVESVRWVAQSGSPVIVANGLTAGQTVTLTVKNVKDAKGNAIPAAGVTRDVKVTSALNWVGVGADEAVDSKGAAFRDDAVVYNESDFDLISGGTANWNAYDEATFVYEEITGDFDRAVRVEYQDPSSQWARAGLHIREALDEGTTRADAEGGESAVKPMSRNLSVRVNPSAGAQGGPANNSYEVIDRNTLGGNYRGTPGGFGGAPPYPNAWMRVARVGKDLKFWKSTDGQNWTNEGTLTWSEPDLAAKLYVGVYYAPELSNNDILAQDKLTAAVRAAFREYGPYPRQSVTPGPLTVARGANGITISWPTGQSAKLQRADAVTGPWADVAGASNPANIPTAGAGGYFRLIGQ